jgi:hypothetical protein
MALTIGEHAGAEQEMARKALKEIFEGDVIPQPRMSGGKPMTMQDVLRVKTVERIREKGLTLDEGNEASLRVEMWRTLRGLATEAKVPTDVKSIGDALNTPGSTLHEKLDPKKFSPESA